MKVIKSPKDFRPQTYFEYLEGEPYRAILGGKSVEVEIQGTIQKQNSGGMVYSTRPQSALVWVQFMTVKDTALTAMKKATNPDNGDLISRQKVLISGLVVMINLLWSIRDRGNLLKWFFSWLRGDQRKFHTFMLNNTDTLFKVFEDVMDFNGRLLRWTKTPPRLQSLAIGSMVEGDFYRECFEGKRPETETWIALCQ